MAEKRYGWFGLKAPIFNRKDPDYCEYGCPVCRAARRGNRLAKLLQSIELAVTFGGCCWGRARERKYGVKPNESLPENPEPAPTGEEPGTPD